jgi:hypothetical protein
MCCGRLKVVAWKEPPVSRFETVAQHKREPQNFMKCKIPSRRMFLSTRSVNEFRPLLLRPRTWVLIRNVRMDGPQDDIFTASLSNNMSTTTQQPLKLPEIVDENGGKVFKLRSYQQEMVEESMRRNIIVAVS